MVIYPCSADEIKPFFILPAQQTTARMPNNCISFLVALEGSDAGLKRALNSAVLAIAGLASAAKNAGAKATQSMAEVRSGVDALGEQISRAKAQLLAFAGISWVTEKATQGVQIADSWNLLIAQLPMDSAVSRSRRRWCNPSDATRLARTPNRNLPCVHSHYF
jgi:hypothetical protein